MSLTPPKRSLRKYDVYRITLITLLITTGNYVKVPLGTYDFMLLRVYFTDSSSQYVLIMGKIL